MGSGLNNSSANCNCSLDNKWMNEWMNEWMLVEFIYILISIEGWSDPISIGQSETKLITGNCDPSTIDPY